MGTVQDDFCPVQRTLFPDAIWFFQESKSCSLLCEAQSQQIIRGTTTFNWDFTSDQWQERPGLWVKGGCHYAKIHLPKMGFYLSKMKRQLFRSRRQKVLCQHLFGAWTGFVFRNGGSDLT